MEENNTLTNPEVARESNDELSFFNFRSLLQTFILNWQWFALSLIICLGITAIYLRYTTPRYSAMAKMLIKDEDNPRSRSTLMSAANLGIISNTEGIDNEMVIISSHALATDVVRDLKLYVSYEMKGRVKNVLVYKRQPISVDIDAAHLDNVRNPIHLTITSEKGSYKVEGYYWVATEDGRSKGPYSIEKTFTTLPQTIKTHAGNLSFTSNGNSTLSEGSTLYVSLVAPDVAAKKYKRSFSISPTSKNHDCEDESHR